MFNYLILLLLVLVSNSSSLLSASVETEDCYSACLGFGEWVYGRGWLIPPYQTIDIGNCIQRPLDEPGFEDVANGGNGGGGQANVVQEAMAAAYDKILIKDVRPGGTTMNAGGNTKNATKEDLVREDLVTGLNAASAGAAVPNSEGLYYCVLDNDSGQSAFYWVLNCGLLQELALGDEVLCGGLTEAEYNLTSAAAGTEPTMIGYVVDDALLGTTGRTFLRFLFNSTHAVRTADQPIAGPTGFECSGRPWFTNNWMCQDPTAVTCPTYFVGTTGLGAFQTYGSTDTVVVAQDIRNYQLCVCLEGMPCEISEASPEPSGPSSLAIGLMVGVGCFFTAVVLFSCKGRIRRNKMFSPRA